MSLHPVVEAVDLHPAPTINEERVCQVRPLRGGELDPGNWPQIPDEIVTVNSVPVDELTHPRLTSRASSHLTVAFQF